MDEQENKPLPPTLSSGDVQHSEYEIADERQKYLDKLRAIVDNIKQPPHPFKGIRLTKDKVRELITIHHEWQTLHPNWQGLVKQGSAGQGELKGLDLGGADLHDADLKELTLVETNFCGADLRGAHLEGTNLSKSYFGIEVSSTELLPPADLRGAFFDPETVLDNITASHGKQVGPQLADVHWGSVDLNGVRWSRVKMLGDEYQARQEKEWDKQIKQYQTAIRANHQLADALQTLGLNESSTHFAHRTQVCQRRFNLLQLRHQLEQLLKYPKLVGILLNKPSTNTRRFFIQTSSFLLVLVVLVIPFFLVHPSLTGFPRLFIFLLSLLALFASAITLFVLWPVLRLTLLFLLIVVFMLALLLGAVLLFIRILQLPLPTLANLLTLLFSALGIIVTMVQAGSFLRREVKIPWKHALFKWITDAASLFVDYGRYIFSGFLDTLAGYGYKPSRALFWYLVVIFGFAAAYNAFGHLSLWPPDAFVFSVASFHGRGFFPPIDNNASSGKNIMLQTSLTLHDPIVMLAAVEAIIGLIIEISFIATFTQRYFGK